MESLNSVVTYDLWRTLPDWWFVSHPEFFDNDVANCNQHSEFLKRSSPVVASAVLSHDIFRTPLNRLLSLVGSGNYADFLAREFVHTAAKGRIHYHALSVLLNQPRLIPEPDFEAVMLLHDVFHNEHSAAEMRVQGILEATLWGFANDPPDGLQRVSPFVWDTLINELATDAASEGLTRLLLTGVADFPTYWVSSCIVQEPILQRIKALSLSQQRALVGLITPRAEDLGGMWVNNFLTQALEVVDSL